MLRDYETTFIITPLLTDEQMKEVAGKFRDYLTSNQAEIVHEENWGLQKLAYPIAKKSTGFYHLIQYRAEPTLINRLEIEYKRDERIMRFLNISLDKHAVTFSARRVRGEFKKKPKEENAEAKAKLEDRPNSNYNRNN
ncbi:MAG: 30S ribosomal protein S6 [Bacteroidota bacterium]|nr:30S ribosomal protein S6 [Bacteroidota bacterium]